MICFHLSCKRHEIEDGSVAERLNKICDICTVEFLVYHYIDGVDEKPLFPFTSPLHRTPVPQESHDCVTWWRLVFIPVVPGRPPNPEWPHHISHSRLGNGLRTWRYVWGTTLKHWGCLRIKAQRNSPVSKKELSSILSVAATPKQDNKYGWQCLCRCCTLKL